MRKTQNRPNRDEVEVEYGGKRYSGHYTMEKETVMVESAYGSRRAFSNLRIAKLTAERLLYQLVSAFESRAHLEQMNRLKGGSSPMKTVTAERRSEIAKKAATERWGKKKPAKGE